MIYIILGIMGLLFIVALFTYISRRRNNTPDEPITPPIECCGAHEVCEKGLKIVDPNIIYYDDEELDAYKHIPSNSYNDAQIDIFRDILYTLRTEEIEDWLISLDKREIYLPEILRPEAIDLIH